MKRISLFILLALPVCLFAQQPIFPLFAQNPRWRIESWNYNGGLPPNIGIFEYFYQKDTIVMGKTYSKLMVKFNEGAAQFEGLIRNEGKETFMRKLFGYNTPSAVLSEEYGLYNFNLKGGNTEEYTFGPTTRCFPSDSFFLAVFSSTDSTVFMGQKRKRIFTNYERPSVGASSRSRQPLEWIEGFGMFNNPFYAIQCFYCADVFYRTMCMDMNGTTIYRDTVRYPNCAPIRVTTNDLQKVKITISPNPVADVIHLNNVDNVDKIQLYGFDGRLIQRFEQADLSKIAVAHLPNGIYFMAFYGKDALFDVRKIVKAD